MYRVQHGKYAVAIIVAMMLHQHALQPKAASTRQRWLAAPIVLRRSKLATCVCCTRHLAREQLKMPKTATACAAQAVVALALVLASESADTAEFSATT